MFVVFQMSVMPLPRQLRQEVRYVKLWMFCLDNKACNRWQGLQALMQSLAKGKSRFGAVYRSLPRISMIHLNCTFNMCISVWQFCGSTRLQKSKKLQTICVKKLTVLASFANYSWSCWTTTALVVPLLLLRGGIETSPDRSQHPTTFIEHSTSISIRSACCKAAFIHDVIQDKRLEGMSEVDCCEGRNK